MQIPAVNFEKKLIFMIFFDFSFYSGGNELFLGIKIFIYHMKQVFINFISKIHVLITYLDIKYIYNSISLLQYIIYLYLFRNKQMK